MDPADRRRAPRFVVDWAAVLLHAGARLEGRLLNVSSSGALVLLPARLPDDAGNVTLELRVPEAAPATFAGVVRWRARIGEVFGHGVEVDGDSLLALVARVAPTAERA